MARNESFILSDDQSANLVWAKEALTPFVRNESRVTIAFTKRDGSPRVISGTAVAFGGNGADTAIVTVNTEAGPRSANLWAIKAISNA